MPGEDAFAERMRDRGRFFARPMPPDYAAEWAHLLAQRPELQTGRSNARIIFRISQVTLALPSKVIRSVSPLLPLCRIPQYLESAFLGLVALAGEIAPCCSLARMLNLPGVTAGVSARTLFLQERPGELWAFPADEVLTVGCGSERPRQEADPHAEIGKEWSETIFEGEDSGATVLLEPTPIFAAMRVAVA